MPPQYRRNNYKHVPKKRDIIIIFFSLLLTINFLVMLISSSTSALSLMIKMVMPTPGPSIKYASAQSPLSSLLSMSQSASLLPAHIKFLSTIPFSSEKNHTDQQQSIKRLVAVNNKLPPITIITDSGVLQTMPATATSNSSSSLKIQSLGSTDIRNMTNIAGRDGQSSSSPPSASYQVHKEMPRPGTRLSPQTTEDIKSHIENSRLNTSVVVPGGSLSLGRSNLSTNDKTLDK
jgi:hypothetical protein